MATPEDSAWSSESSSPPEQDSPERPTALIRLALEVAGRSLEAEVRLPVAPIRPVDLLPILMSFDDAILDVVVGELLRQGKTISCRKGCGACCKQLVPIGDVEARYLVEVLSELPEPRRTQLETRFAAAVQELERQGILDRLRRADQLTSHEERRQLGLDYFACGVECPFLENQSCSIHRDRPLVCREYLVTSAPESCSAPLPQRITLVQLPVMLSKLLRRFGDAVGDRPACWLPLVLVQEWVAHHPELSPQVPGPEMFARFLKLVAARRDELSSGGPIG